MFDKDKILAESEEQRCLIEQQQREILRQRRQIQLLRQLTDGMREELDALRVALPAKPHATERRLDRGQWPLTTNRPRRGNLVKQPGPN
jgi:hypothetical protein